MYMASARVGGMDENRNLVPLRNTIVLLADADLFSECLAQALAVKFPDCEIVSLSDQKAFHAGGIEGVRLVLLYHIAAGEVHDTLQALRTNYPDTSVGLVVEAINLLDPYVARLVEGRNIDGVLPLNLRLDVFMAAIELLMKGGEHFPSALLRRLAVQPQMAGQSMYGAPAALAASSRPYASSAAPAGNMMSLTTREVQILDLICKGTQNKIIADQLHLSENTVKVHVRNIYKKMNVRNRTEAASRFFNSDPGQDRDQLRKWNN
ncbi:response regulator transcription factor [Rhizobium sp. BK251]|uniref:helix-turn-helix transcriptional regulator n=1 Tax=Rhizobium sp. BK251 TaxID=2512125 RepID=UPI00104A27C5|nr:response regulator transcription factor [Rhizobium sp. BK251]TCL69524.1 DNA-binding NarL/FixJ family response regulator [Rhizobium sp. BK251]